MRNFNNKTFAIISTDKDIGGISSMIEISTMAIASKIKKVYLFLLKNSKTTQLIKKYFSYNKKIIIYELTILDEILMSFGALSKSINNKILSSDLIFLHNAKLINNFSQFYNIKPIVLFFHTDKEKHIKYMSYFNRVFTVNSSMKNKINNNLNIKKAYLLPNCVKNINYKNYFNLQRNKKFTVGTMCRLVEKKGISLLIEVFKTIPDIDLIIAGDGPLRNQYMKEVNGYKNIKFIGWVNNKETFYANIDVFCLSSTIEPFGLVILESMVRGIPVISTNCNGPNDIIKNNKNGILFSKNNFSILKNILHKLKTNPDLRKKISKNGLDTIKKNYTIDVYTKNLFSLIKDL